MSEPLPACVCGRPRTDPEELTFPVHCYMDGGGALRQAFCVVCVSDPDTARFIHEQAVARGWLHEGI